MSKVKNTVFRKLEAKSLDEIITIIGSLPFKIEIKYGHETKKGYVLCFTLPDHLDKISQESFNKLGV
jgi:hypothetical protein